MTIDKRKHYGIIIDTETANTIEDNFAYDFGWAVIDTHGNIYRTRSFVNANVFLDEKELMKTSYYADKIPQYWEDIKSGKRVLTSLWNIRKTLHEDCKEFGCEFIIAHNARFDKSSGNKTLRYVTKSKMRWFYPRNLVWYDTMKMAREAIAKTPSYQRFCEENDFMTNHKTPRCRITAEVLYRYITNNVYFSEEHKGLDDVLIENEIFKYCRNVKRLPMAKGLLSP